jgi:predicted permease
LDEALERDLERGIAPGRARRRYLRNVLGSAASLWAARLSPARLSPSVLDAKLGLRMLRKHPGMTAVSLLALGIGIPLGLAPSWLADGIEGPFPAPEGDRIQAIRYWDPVASRPESATWFDYTRWREGLTSFESLGALRVQGYNVSVGGEMGAPVAGAEITASAFEILRAGPLLGRSLVPEDETLGGAEVAVIGYDLWQGRFGGDPEVLGRTFTLAGVSHTVVGVMPDGFRFPASQQLWLPMREAVASEPGTGIGLRVFGRLADGVSPGEADAEVARMGQRLALDYPTVYAKLRPEVVKSAMLFLAFPRGGAKAMPEFYFVQLLALVLLVVASVNVALLTFARTASRASELSVRAALGASRARIVSQVFTECLVLALAAAGIGLAILAWIPGLVPPDVMDRLPYWIDLGITPRLALRALALAGVSAVAAGVVPAWRFTGANVQETIQRARSGRSGVRFGGVTSALVVVDVAVCVAVIGFSVSLADYLRDAWTAQSETVGFDDQEYLSAEIMLAANGSSAASDPVDRDAFRRRVGEVQIALTERLETEPGITGVTVASTLPRMEHGTQRVEVEHAGTGEDVRAGAKVARVDVGFFGTLGTPVLAGRDFRPADLDEGVAVAIVNESFVRRVLEGRNPIGRRVRYGRIGQAESSGWYEVVGVVGRAGMNIMDPDDDSGIYVPLAPGDLHPFRLAVHVGADPESFTPRLRALVAEVDPNAVVVSPMALDRVYEGDWYIVAAMSAGLLLGVGILLALAASGIYAIMSFTVAERTREIGLRTALGAHPRQVAYAVARRSLTQLTAGVALGMPVAWFLFVKLGDGGAVSAMAFVASVVPGVLVLAGMGLASCAAPTLRALRIAPTEALKAE